jgi:small-conductance mechanosensitive channel
MAGLRAGILSAPPIWDSVRTEPAPLGALVERNIESLFAGTSDFLNEHSGALLLFGLIACGLIVLAMQLQRMGQSAAGAQGVAGVTLRRPYLVLAMLWILLGSELLLPDLDAGLALLRAGLVLGVLGVLLPEFAARATVAPLRGLLVAAILVMAERPLLDDALYGRLLAMLVAAYGIWLFRRLYQSLQTAPIHSGDAAASILMLPLLRTFSRGLARIAPFLLLTGLLAEAIGAERLGGQLISSVLYLAAALAAYIAADVLVQDAVAQILAGPAANWLRAVRKYPALVTRYGVLVCRILLVIGFVAMLPRLLPLLQPAWRAIAQVLGTPLGLGSISISLLDVIAFAVSVVVAVNAARLVRFLLQEDVVSRLPVSDATASAVTRLAYYGIMVAGVLFAFAAAGLELSQLTMVVSALGVGIGFGLQDIVKNFVSGLVIAFEHPFREGDVIATGQITGRLQEIGLRASRIRTIDGAEVMVPNANLISAEVTNWTLSDRTRRIEIIVGVDYDSEPRQVLDVLREAVSGQPGLVSHPAPLVLFRNFAASALEFSVSVWTADIDDRLEVESEARLRIFAALRAAGIGIPFPQLDLHVRAVSPELRASSHSP